MRAETNFLIYNKPVDTNIEITLYDIENPTNYYLLGVLPAAQYAEADFNIRLLPNAKIMWEIQIFDYSSRHFFITDIESGKLTPILQNYSGVKFAFND